MKLKKDILRAAKNRLWLRLYKVQKGCFDCGYKNHHAALEFDHLPEFKKQRTISSMCYSSLETIKKEIDKCQVVCANCHNIRTFDRIAKIRE